MRPLGGLTVPETTTASATVDLTLVHAQLVQMNMTLRNILILLDLSFLLLALEVFGGFFRKWMR